MSLLLNIDTANEIATVSLALDGNIIDSETNTVQKEHASFLHKAIQKVLLRQNKNINELHAIAVTAGPGSYTGLRVGLASAKGLCMALNKPLITLNVLEVMAENAIEVCNHFDGKYLFCPMIDARRMEVFTALYNEEGKEIIAPYAALVDENFLTDHMQQPIVFFGSGTFKCKNVPAFQDKIFIENVNALQTIANVSYRLFSTTKYTPLINSVPFYLKAFYIP